MSGVLCKIGRGIAAAFCAFVTTGIALGSATYQSFETVDFPSNLTTETLPIRSPEDASAAVSWVTSDPVVEEGSWVLLDEATPDLSQTTLDLSEGVVSIDAGQIESAEGWSSLLENPAGWRTPRDESASDPQGLFFTTASAAEPATTGFASNVSVIPLPAALTSAGVTCGLIGGVWIVRRLRGSRPTH